ncbi:ribonuclease P protein component [Halobacillus karajensis]|uniref:Ribonuclease P protein component n=1 Tax=Halobacillus karajensis TaxID=195088 RepID=A0A059NZ07_9BACI|nr:ribonuclease P protein component [Halobacillus karajensis]CDQ18392.1 Ribonuclease P protein component [Halobacillus karajensis]CDQ23536.1 Ribonuclease P protein component [Halobacillus karajensis]CDQ27018.1 Ribonuclease P protein component [Halobacillus karajensis]SEH52039.1 ribonuclease P protein component [Halobacillus karajensis]
MKKAYRIKKNEDFQEVFKRGQSFANRQLVLYYMKKEDQTHFRIGLSVSKKIGHAVMRNQIKRYLRQAFHELENDIHPQYDLVVIARKPTNQMGFHEVKKSLTHVLVRSKLLNKKIRT